MERNTLQQNESHGFADFTFGEIEIQILIRWKKEIEKKFEDDGHKVRAIEVRGKKTAKFYFEEPFSTETFYYQFDESFNFIETTGRWS